MSAEKPHSGIRKPITEFDINSLFSSEPETFPFRLTQSERDLLAAQREDREWRREEDMLVVSALITAPGLMHQAQEGMQDRRARRAAKIKELEEKAAKAHKQQVVDAEERSRRDPSLIVRPRRREEY